MAKENSIIQEIKSEKEDFYSDDSIYNINSWGADLTFRELIDRYKENELVKPEIQRNYIWDKIEASYFIDSVLLGLPLPSIFLAKTSDEKMLIIDGFQRIMTIYDYVNGIFSKDNKVFRLSKSSRINERWRGKAFSELSPEEQRRVKNTTIHSIIFYQVHPTEDDTSMYQIFERINTTGRTLLPQEIRNCVYQGPFNELLIGLNTNPTWRILYGLENPDSRMRDIEFILRYFALSSSDFRNKEITAISLKKFLNIFMGSSSSDSETLVKRETNFNMVIETIYNLYGSEAFHNISPKYPDKLVNKFNPTIFDSIMIATSYVLDKKFEIPMNGNRSKRRSLLENEKYQDAISVRTTNIEKILTRISLACQYLYDKYYE